MNRGRDAADVLTATVGRGVGAKAKVGPVQAALVWNQDVAGLRCGEISYWSALTPINMDLKMVRLPPRPFEQLLPLPVIPFELGIHGGGEMYVSQSLARERGKDFWAFNMFPFVPLAVTPSRGHSVAWSYYTQIEAVVALGPSVRLGFNPGELFDFLLGWMAIDIFNDDLGSLGQTMDGRLHTGDASRGTSHAGAESE